VEKRAPNSKPIDPSEEPIFTEVISKRKQKLGDRHPSRRASKKKAPVDDGLDRLHVRIARSGMCSRRAAETLIDQARVEVNGKIVVEKGTKVGPDDEVRVDGKPIVQAKKYTLLFNKPAGVVTTLRDPQGRPTIASYLPNYGVMLKPVGRLDKETDGLLIVTNDGDLALRIAHPRYNLDKEYHAIVEGIPDEKSLNKLRDGVFIEGGKTAPAQVSIIHAEERTRTTSLKIIIHEGRKRQVRYMCDAVGHPVIKLTRTRIGPFVVRGLKPGECVLMGQKDLQKLRAIVGLESDDSE
jgi:23S rRNA pseudouridine2605 synthase